MNGSSLSNGLAQGIAATLAASNGGHQQPQQTSVGNGLKEFLLEQHQLVRHLVLVNVVVVDTQWAKTWKKSVVISIKFFWREKNCVLVVLNLFFYSINIDSFFYLWKSQRCVFGWLLVVYESRLLGKHISVFAAF